jgi:hypothetical protein
LELITWHFLNKAIAIREADCAKRPYISRITESKRVDAADWIDREIRARVSEVTTIAPDTDNIS